MAPVIVYTNPSCPPCNAVKRWLSNKNIAFEERPAEDHLDYLADLGVRATPATVVGTKVIHGFDVGALNDLLLQQCV